jgi:hypothetical protein
MSAQLLLELRPQRYKYINKGITIMGRYISTTGTANIVTREITTTYQAVSADRLICNASGAPFTITLPAVAGVLVGDQIQIIDAASQFAINNVTVARNGALINGTAEDLTLDVIGSVVTLLYTGATYGWVIVST